MSAEKTEHTGIYAWPGTVATVITVLIGVAFIGALYLSATGDHGDEGHGAEATEEGAH